MSDRRANRNLAGSTGRTGRLFRFLLAGLAAVAGLATATDCASGAEPALAEPLRVAVYDMPPYGYVDADGSIAGVSVDLWRRVAQQTQWQFRFIPVADMEAVLSGLEQSRYDAAIGAITITPERSERVDFSYPAHRSGVAAAFRKETGPLSALAAYGAAAAELSPLILAMAAMLVATGLAMWFLERPGHPAAQKPESSVATLRDGVYWAVVTMTTVGYGDKTPKTNAGRMIAILWMLGSVVLVSLLSTSMVSRLTAERVESGADVALSDLTGKKLAAAAHSSGAEYLDGLHLAYAKFPNLQEALDSLADGRSDAVVNSVGALQHLIAKRYAKVVQAPQGLLAPAYMAIALPAGSPLKKPLDRALMKITAGAEWRSAEERFFGR
jgi:ABC-type amino acid transport substrate-binding protein